MAKAITLADLNTALKPIIEALNKLREEQSANTSQNSETHSMVTNISVKIDTLEQTAGATLSEVSKPAAKKPTGRKPAAGRKPAVKKPPTKRGTKAVAPEADDAEAPEADDAEAPEAEDVEAPEADDAEAPEADEDAASTSTPKKAAVKRAAPKKAAAAAAPKKAPVKKAAPVKKLAPKKTTVSRLNKMTIFKDTFKKDPSKFDKYLTSKVKKTIEAENDKWKELTGEPLANAQRSAYYHYMKDNHDAVLETLKTEHAAQEPSAEVEEDAE